MVQCEMCIWGTCKCDLPLESSVKMDFRGFQSIYVSFQVIYKLTNEKTLSCTKNIDDLSYIYRKALYN